MDESENPRKPRAVRRELTANEKLHLLARLVDELEAEFPAAEVAGVRQVLEMVISLRNRS